MHAQAGTIGYDLIHDEEARQQAKRASREQFYAQERATLTSGTSTPSSAASPPHDAEAAREVERLRAAKHLEFLALVRAWADGDPVPAPAPAGIDPAKARALIDSLGHLARQCREGPDDTPTTSSFRLGQSHGFRQAALLVGDLLR